MLKLITLGSYNLYSCRYFDIFCIMIRCIEIEDDTLQNPHPAVQRLSMISHTI